jgi:D-2-hydroxyacid dehydrogenase (NADP+)
MNKQRHVLIGAPLTDRQIESLAAANPNLEYDCVTSEFQALLSPVKPASEGVLEKSDTFQRLLPLLHEAEIIYAFTDLPDLYRHCPKLRWVHFIAHGIDALKSDVLSNDVIITTGQGSQAIMVAEFTISMILMLAKRASIICSQRNERLWRRFPTVDVYGSTLGVIGFGSIGRLVARYAKTLGMKVIATKRTFTDVHPAYIDEMVPIEQLDYVLRQSDFLVLAAPLTATTFHLIGHQELGMMKPTSFLINISRGELVNEAALAWAIKEKRLAGAALDVFQHEPLPSDSPFWEMAEVIITPHIAGNSPRFLENANALFSKNLRRYLNGKPLLNVYDRAKGY